MNPRFSISVKGVRSVKDAEIDLNGITVLAGENGCGKTTISKLLYLFVKTSVNFDSIVDELYSKEISFLASLLEDLLPQKNSAKVIPSGEIGFHEINAALKIPDTYYSEKYLYIVLIPRIEFVRQKYEDKTFTIADSDFTRLFQIYEEHVKRGASKNITGLLNDFESYAKEIGQKISELKTKHRHVIFDYQFLKYLNEDIDARFYSVKEYGADLINKESDVITLQKSFSDVIYIDVPTVFDVDFNQPSTRNSITSDLRTALYDEKEFKGNGEIDEIISDILNGQISRGDDLFAKIFWYTSKTGKSIPLSQAASGVKCFAVLERLYATGHIGKNTLLIVDEPEVHLHPKWIVEYARVLVLIQKYLHTTILIASHNPDMVSAIKYISAKEKISESTTFYVAEEIDSEDFGRYRFKNLGTNIEGIFSSFNIALDRINQYGDVDDE